MAPKYWFCKSGRKFERIRKKACMNTITWALFHVFYSLPLRNFTSSVAASLACHWNCRPCSQLSSPRSGLRSSRLCCWTPQTCSLRLKTSSKCSMKRRLSKNCWICMLWLMLGTLSEPFEPLSMQEPLMLHSKVIVIVFSCIPQGQEIRRSSSQTLPPSQCWRKGRSKSRMSSMKSTTIGRKSD